MKILLGIVALILLMILPIKGEETMRSKIFIDLSKTLTTFQGFGVSGAWWAQDIGKRSWCREEITKLLFSKDEGIGIQIYRYYIGAGEPNNISDPWRRGTCLEIKPGEYDLSRDPGGIWILKKAVELGVNKVVAFAYSPPARMTISGTTDGGDGSTNLKENMYDDFACYLVDIAELLLSEGIPLEEISPINEPQWDWNKTKGQEGCHYEPDEVVLLLKELIKELDRRGLADRIKIAAPEAGEWGGRTRKYAEAMFNDPLINERIDEFHLHSYWSSTFDKQRFVKWFEKEFSNKKIVMSEWCEMVNGRDITMDSALELAHVIIEDLLIGKVTEWHYWIAVSKYDYRDGLIYVDYDSSGNIVRVIPTKRLWVFGNFCKFIKPGYKVISPLIKDGYLRGVVFSSPNNTQIVLVIVNPSKNAHKILVNFSEGHFKLEGCYLTDEEHDLSPIYVNDEILIPSRSVLTILYDSD